MVPRVCFLAGENARFLYFVRERYRVILQENQTAEATTLKFPSAQLLVLSPTQPHSKSSRVLVSVAFRTYLDLVRHSGLDLGLAHCALPPTLDKTNGPKVTGQREIAGSRWLTPSEAVCSESGKLLLATS